MYKSIIYEFMLFCNTLIINACYVMVFKVFAYFFAKIENNNRL